MPTHYGNKKLYAMPPFGNGELYSPVLRDWEAVCLCHTMGIESCVPPPYGNWGVVCPCPMGKGSCVPLPYIGIKRCMPPHFGNEKLYAITLWEWGVVKTENWKNIVVRLWSKVPACNLVTYKLNTLYTLYNFVKLCIKVPTGPWREQDEIKK